MPSNLAPEIIITVQNPEPGQSGTSSGSGKSEKFSNSSSSGPITSMRSKHSRQKLKNSVEPGEANSSSSKENGMSKVRLKSKHNPHPNSIGKGNVSKKDSKSSVTTAIDMIEGKPRLWVSPRKSASAVRVQVTLHRPLNWQVVPTSSSTGSVPSQLVKQSSSFTKSTVTHSQSLSQSESLSFSISPSPSILSPSNKCHSRNNFLQDRKGKVRFTELPRSRLGRHIEKIEKDQCGSTVSQSLCFCQCAYSGDRQEESGNIDDESGSRSVLEQTLVSSSLSDAVPQRGNSNGNPFVSHCACANKNCCDITSAQQRPKKSRSASTRRRAFSYHDGDHTRLGTSSTSSSDNEGKKRNIFFLSSFIFQDMS